MLALKKKLIEIVGQANVKDRKETLEKFASDESIFPGVMPSCVVQPTCSDGRGFGEYGPGPFMRVHVKRAVGA